MKYTNIINVVTTENGLRELIGNPIFEMAEKISRLSNDRLYHVVITVDNGGEDYENLYYGFYGFLVISYPFNGQLIENIPEELFNLFL